MTADVPDQSLRAAFDELQRINSLLDRISRVHETNHIMAMVISELVKLTGANQGVISLVTRVEGDELTTVVRDRAEAMDELPFPIHQSLAGWAIQNRRILKVDNLEQDDRFHGLSSEDGRFTSILCVPMLARGDTLGITSLVREKARGPFTDDHSRQAGIIGTQAAQVLSNALLMQQLARSNELLKESQRKLQEENASLTQAVAAQFTFENILGKSGAIREVLRLASKVSSNDSPVLITGPTGTGKELVARAIHFNGKRRNKPFVVKNCGVKTETLLESELFGHTKGAFTGADRQRPGLFREADGGTIFLDEIGDAPLSTQVAILRTLESGEIRPVGASKPEYVDVRIISATNKDLRRAMEDGGFREDLFYRLNAVTIELPPLSQRPEDIPLLVEAILAKQRIRLCHDEMKITDAALEALKRYAWPGNIRQLENEIERAVVMSDDGVIELSDLSTELRGTNSGSSPSAQGQLRQTVETVERDWITRTLRETEGNILQSAKILGLTRKGLKDKMSRYGITAAEESRAGDSSA